MTSDTKQSSGEGERHGLGGTLGQVAGRSSKGKSIVHTIDPDFILGIGRISEFGARKYHRRNFLMAPGMEWSQVYESLLRHLFAWWGGEELDIGPNGEFGPTDDPETNMKWSGMPHLLHVAWNVMALYTYSHNEVYHPGDDRPSTLEYAGGSWKAWNATFEAIRTRDDTATAEHFDKLARDAGIVKDPAYIRDPLRAGLVKDNEESK